MSQRKFDYFRSNWKHIERNFVDFSEVIFQRARSTERSALLYHQSKASQSFKAKGAFRFLIRKRAANVNAQSRNVLNLICSSFEFVFKNFKISLNSLSRLKLTLSDIVVHRLGNINLVSYQLAN